MIFQGFKWLFIQLLVGAAVVFACAAAVFVAQGGAAALALVDVSFNQLNSLWVWAFGYGLMTFVMYEGKTLPVEMKSILRSSDAVDETVNQITRSTSHKRALFFTVPITAVGLLLTIGYEVPHDGLGKILITLGITSIYYVAAFLLSHFFFVTRAFHVLYQNVDDVEFSELIDAHRLECVTGYLGVTTFFGVCAIYSGFRGTLTAEFLMPNPELRLFLITPLVLFLPMTLFYNYYPRYCLRRIVQYRVFRLMKDISQMRYDDLKDTILELKEATALTAQILPFVDHKTIPSYFVAILLLVSISFTHDPVVKEFLSLLFGAQP